MKDMLYWIWLSVTLVPGSDSFALLRGSFSSPKEIFEADAEAIEKILGAKRQQEIERLARKDLRRAYAIRDFMALKNVKVLVYDDPRYPQRLREIPNPPVMLYYAGQLPDLEKSFCVSCVGSRAHTDYAKNATFEVAFDLALGGATVVSGLAYGLDSVALAAAHSAEGRTISVLGSGIDIIYPKEHVLLARTLAKNGAVMTEYPPGTSPSRQNFPTRNRIIAALGHAVVVTGGTVGSGALITADIAKKHKRPIYAIPGNIDDVFSQGPAVLLKEGAKPVTAAEDILYDFEEKFPSVIKVARLLLEYSYRTDKTLKELGVVSQPPEMARIKNSEFVARYTPREGTEDAELAKRLAEKDAPAETSKPEQVEAPKKPSKASGLPALSNIEQMVLDAIPAKREVEIDDLVEAVGFSLGKVQAALTMLEIKGLIIPMSSTRFRRV